MFLPWSVFSCFGEFPLACYSIYLQGYYLRGLSQMETTFVLTRQSWYQGQSHQLQPSHWQWCALSRSLWGCRWAQRTPWQQTFWCSTPQVKGVSSWLYILLGSVKHPANLGLLMNLPSRSLYRLSKSKTVSLALAFDNDMVLLITNLESFLWAFRSRYIHKNVCLVSIKVYNPYYNSIVRHLS